MTLVGRSGRDETAAERADRNFGDLLQELRVAQTGVQILFAFLLTLTFTQRFPELGSGQQRLYGVTVAFSAAAMAFLVGPVAAHRLAFRQRRKERVLQLSHRMSLTGLLLMGLAILCSVFLTCWVGLGIRWAYSVGASAGVAIVAAWLVLPSMVRAGRPSAGYDSET
jgi:hypothetical protein